MRQTEFTNGGDLNHFLESGQAAGQTVGQLFCGHLASKRQPYQVPTFVYLYMSVCEKSWEYTETTTRSQLCCIAGQFSTCDKVPGFKLHSSPPLRHARPVEITVSVAGM